MRRWKLFSKWRGAALKTFSPRVSAPHHILVIVDKLREQMQ